MPVSPRISTVESVGATLAISRCDGLHLFALPDQLGRALEPGQPLLERPVLVRELAFFRHAAQNGFQVGQLAGLGQVVERPLPQGGDGRFQRRFAGQDHRLGLGRKLLRPGDHVDAVAAGHVQIDDEAVVGVPPQGGQGGGAVGADRGLVAHPRQLQPHQFLQRRLVVGEQQLQPLVRLGGARSFHGDWGLGLGD